MNIVVLEADSLGKDIDLSVLNELGDVTVYDITLQEEANERIKDADVVILNKILINDETLEGADHVKLISLTATGFNNIDLDCCKRRGITVTNSRGYSTPTVAQHTFAMVLSLMEHLPFYDEYVKGGTYSKGGRFSYIDKHFCEVNGKKWGIIGLGSIGRKVAEIAHAFGAQVVYYSASGQTYDVPYEKVTLDELLSSCDIVSLHCPLTENTNHLLNYEKLQMMKENSILINVARGPVIDEEGFVKSFNQGKPYLAGLDVFEKEPLPSDSALFGIKDMDRIIMTPHIGWGSFEARSRLLEDVMLSIKGFLEGNPRSTVV